MSGIPIQCDGCPSEERCCQLDSFIDMDDRDWPEWCGDVMFPAVMWTVLASIALGFAGLCFFVGVWGYVNALALLQM